MTNLMQKRNFGDTARVYILQIQTSYSNMLLHCRELKGELGYVGRRRKRKENGPAAYRLISHQWHYDAK